MEEDRDRETKKHTERARERERGQNRGHTYSRQSDSGASVTLAVCSSNCGGAPVTERRAEA